MKHTRESVLAAITAAPIRFGDLAGSKAHRARVGLRIIVDRLTAQGLIRTTYIDRFPHLVLADWQPSAEQTVAILLARGRRTVDGCLLWSGYTDPLRGPMASIGTPPIPTSVRRKVWSLKKRALDFNETIKPSCGNWSCVAYEHMELATRADALIGRSKTPEHARRIAQGLRTKIGKLSMEIAREVRASSESSPKLAIKYGVSKQAIDQIRRGETWKEYQQGLFTGLIDARKRA